MKLNENIKILTFDVEDGFRVDIIDDKDYTIRSCETGAVICTGITARDEYEAEEKFMNKQTVYADDEIYASESGWND